MMRGRARRRHEAMAHMMRRLKEDRNQHYRWRECPCLTDRKAMARFKEQPQVCSGRCCGNPRHHEKGEVRLTMQERRAEYMGRES